MVARLSSTKLVPVKIAVVVAAGVADTAVVVVAAAVAVVAAAVAAVMAAEEVATGTNRKSFCFETTAYPVDPGNAVSEQRVVGIAQMLVTLFRLLTE